MQDDQYFIDRELGQATLACLDPTWDGADLVIDLRTGVKVSLVRVGADGFGVPSDDVYVAVGKLVQLHKAHATGLQRATYAFRRRSDGKWSFTADYLYPP